ncbi:MAG TPA: zf-HC2 domain-containing protein [Acidobacteriota bacterium]|nr:zf-HC2 domain-containing protein [Acidobacteriota bacterium]
MECAEVRTWIFRKIDGELSESETVDFDNHVAHCSSCAREYRFLAFPHRVASEIPPVTVSPFFYKKLSLRIEREAQGMIGWQLFWRLERQLIPALAGITLALLMAFAYLQLQGSKADSYQDYRGVFITEEQPHRMLSGEQADITDASVLSAIADRQYEYRNRNGK